ncbi:DNA repair protein RecO [Candidatus Peregrinibacteria bacterium]|nr:DNA repair protein RecO [Candidatus Peregrinibacteria bacterium]
MIHRKIYGIIIKIQPLGELDRIVTVFSEEYGVISVIAKGVKKITSRRGFHLDLLNAAHIDIEESGSESMPRRYLREVTPEENFLNLKNSPEHFSAGCIMAAFIKRTIPEGAPQKTLFDLTQKTLRSLNQNNDASSDPKIILSTYFLKTLKLLGHLPGTLKKREIKPYLQKTLQALDPEFTLNARRTLGIFSKFESTRSS